MSLIAEVPQQFDVAAASTSATHNSGDQVSPMKARSVPPEDFFVLGNSLHERWVAPPTKTKEKPVQSRLLLAVGLSIIFVGLSRCIGFESALDAHLSSSDSLEEWENDEADEALVPSCSGNGDCEASILAETAPVVGIVEPDVMSDADDSNVKLESDKIVASPPTTHTISLTRHSSPVSTQGNIVYYRSAYYGTVHVGTPAVPFKVVFDTGSGHLILPSTYCQSETCRAHRRYRRADSGTAKDIDYDGTQVAPGQPRDQITVSFGTGEVTGVFVEDVVCMHGDSSLDAIANQTSAYDANALALTTQSSTDELDRGCVKLRLIAATAMSEDPFKDFAFDGVMGLGLGGLSQSPEFNFLDVLSASFDGVVTTPQTFAVFLGGDEEEESKITFGGWDDNHLTDELSWNSVLDPEQGHWTIRIKSLRIGDQVLQFCESGCKGVVDTGTSLLAVPSASFAELYTLLRHPAHMEGHCHGSGPELHLELDDFTITLGPEDYARLERTPQRKKKPVFGAKPHNVATQGRTDMHCKPMLMSMDLPAPLGPKLFILGEPVLRKYYSVYDAKDKRVGFAKARHYAKPTSPLLPEMTPALKQDTAEIEKSKTTRTSMFDAFRTQRLHQYN